MIMSDPYFFLFGYAVILLISIPFVVLFILISVIYLNYFRIKAGEILYYIKSDETAISVSVKSRSLLNKKLSFLPLWLNSEVFFTDNSIFYLPFFNVLKKYKLYLPSSHFYVTSKSIRRILPKGLTYPIDTLYQHNNDLMIDTFIKVLKPHLFRSTNHDVPYSVWLRDLFNLPESVQIRRLLHEEFSLQINSESR